MLGASIYYRRILIGLDFDIRFIGGHQTGRENTSRECRISNALKMSRVNFKRGVLTLETFVFGCVPERLVH